MLLRLRNKMAATKIWEANRKELGLLHPRHRHREGWTPSALRILVAQVLREEDQRQHRHPQEEVARIITRLLEQMVPHHLPRQDLRRELPPLLALPSNSERLPRLPMLESLLT